VSRIDLLKIWHPMKLQLFCAACFGFLFDLPWFSQMGISVSLALATYFAGDFVDALLALWQALAVGAVVFLIVGLFSDGNVNAGLAAAFVPLFWLIILRLRFHSLGLEPESHSQRSSASIVGLLVLFIFLFRSPDGIVESFQFLSAEDNERWLTSIISVIFEKPLSLSAEFDSFSVQFFTKYFLNTVFFISRIGREIVDDSGLFSLVVLSNAWIFTLISYVFFVLRIVSRINRLSDFRFNPLLTNFIVSGFTVLFFRASQDVGHFPQFLLTATVLTVTLTAMCFDLNLSGVRKLGLFTISAAVSISLVGSYNPWVPLSIVAFVLSLNSLFDGMILRKVFFSKKLVFVCLISLVPIITIVRLLSSRYSGLDEQGGVHEVPIEAVWCVGVFIFLLAGDILKRRFIKSEDRGRRESSSETENQFWPIAMCIVLPISILLGFDHNQMSTLMLLLFIGLIFNRKTVARIIDIFRKMTEDPRFDTLLLLGFFSFVYGVAIFALSRFIGPVYEPMYASKKSMLAVFSQFGWLPIVVICIQKTSRFRFQRYLTQLLIGVGTVFLYGLASFVSYSELKSEWWIEPVVDAVQKNPDAVIICASSNWKNVDYEVYTCNRFLQTLSNYEYPASGSRYLAWYQPEEFGKISDWFNGARGRARNFDKSTKVVVLSRAELDIETKTMFEGVSAENLEFQVIPYTESKS